VCLKTGTRTGPKANLGSDPLFQRILVDTVRRSAHLFASRPISRDGDEIPNAWSGLPVIADEVFTGFYRLGRRTACSFLGVQPDISVHAKLLTGGLLPLSATLASESIFDAFKSDDKSDALLHGHSYTAHAVGCQVAVQSLKEMKKMVARGEQRWMQDGDCSNLVSGASPRRPWSMWSSEFLRQVVERKDRVEGAWALGSVLAIHMKSGDGSGYKSTAAAALKTRLAEGTVDSDVRWSVHSRVLGNVFYVMGSLKTREEDVTQLESMIMKSL
jgi:bifunctional dethiobiotin synthetase / adenosylmethionine---8-amino-7-oxononanoate aminotransferase